MSTETWSVLPSHIVTTILGYLPLDERQPAASVCTAWHFCLGDPSLWRTVDFMFIRLKVGLRRNYLEIIETYGRFIKYVTLYVNQGQQENREDACTILHALVVNIPNVSLRYFKLACVGENPLFYDGAEFLLALEVLFGTKKCQNETGFTNVDLGQLGIAYDDKIFFLLAENHQHLEKLNIQNSSIICKVSPMCILNLVKRCRHLKELQLFHTSLSNDVLVSLAEEYRSPVEHLNILCRREQKFTEDLSSDTWLALTAACPKLRVTLGFDHTCPFDKIPVIMKPEIPVRELKLETFTLIYEEVNFAATYYKETLNKVTLQTRNSRDLGNSLINLAKNCTKLKSLLVYCVLDKDVVDKIFSYLPDMKTRNTYILKTEMEPEPWLVGEELDYWTF